MSADNYKKIILARMHSVLKPEGFRKKGATFSSEQNEVVLFVQLQSSRKSTRDILIATVNVGVFSKTIAWNLGNTHEPNILEAHWRDRIGFFFPVPHDKWWESKSDEKADFSGREIGAILAKLVLPEMKTVALEINHKSFWESGQTRGSTDYQRKEYLQALDGPKYSPLQMSQWKHFKGRE
jgi:Domain of unknown function (DUF4304)